MGYAKDDPITKTLVATHRAAGDSFREIERKTGIPRSTASDLANNNDEVKELILKEAQRLTECLPKAVDNLKGLVNNFHKEKKGSKERYLGWVTSCKIAESVGALGGSQQSVIVQNTFNQTINNYLSPAVLALLQKESAIVEGECEEAEYSEGGTMYAAQEGEK